jgi:hypothetical protein
MDKDNNSGELDKSDKKLHISDVSDNEVKFCEDCQKWVKPPKCNHCGNEDLIPDWTY